MIAKQFYSSFRLKFTYLQKREIQYGIENGLHKEEIQMYADTMYNFAQMKQLRLALEHHIDPSTRHVLFDPSLDADEMQKIRYALEKGHIVKRKQYYVRKWLIIGVEICALSFLSFVTFRQKTYPVLQLKTNEITLQRGEPFLASYYVDMLNGENATFLYPEYLNTSTLGKKAAVYKLIMDDTELTRILYVNVVDEN